MSPAKNADKEDNTMNKSVLRYLSLVFFGVGKCDASYSIYLGVKFQAHVYFGGLRYEAPLDPSFMYSAIVPPPPPPGPSPCPGEAFKSHLIKESCL